MNKDFQFNPDDNTVRFGAANSLNESGNVFDAYQNDRYPGSLRSADDSLKAQGDGAINRPEPPRSDANGQTPGGIASASASGAVMASMYFLEIC